MKLKKVRIGILIIIFFCMAVIGFIVNLKINHSVNIQPLGAYEDSDAEEYYDILFSQEEFDSFIENYDMSFSLPKEFDFKHDAVLVCSGHELIEGYYNISDEDNIFRTTHFLYVVLNKNKENKVFLYKIPNKYRNWYFSERYSDSFNGIIYR